MEPWHKVDLAAHSTLESDPNVELERGNQPGAHTDCLLYYKVGVVLLMKTVINFKDAAEFVIFADVGDILAPTRGLSYTEEFRWFAAEHPLAAGFVYSRQRAVLPGKLASSGKAWVKLSCFDINVCK